MAETNRNLDMGAPTSFVTRVCEIYETKIFPRIKDRRGATRLRIWSRNISVSLVSSKTDEGSYSVNKVKQKPTFSDKDDIKYFALKERTYCIKFLSEINENSIVADLGGYHGSYSILAPTKEKCYCFEPSPRNRDEIRKNMDLNPDKDIVLVEKPVWSEEEEVNVENSESQTRIAEKGDAVTAVTLDRYFEDKDSPDVIKLDIQGAEMHALRGAREIIEKSKPVLFIEIHKDKLKEFGSSEEEVMKFLEKQNYDITYSLNRANERLIIAR